MLKIQRGWNEKQKSVFWLQEALKISPIVKTIYINNVVIVISCSKM